MATTVVKNYNIAPYYDDFDETKNYHRILFKPGYSVQARELTQLQTALQAQIDRYGQFAFKDGSRVINGKATLNVEYDFIKIESSFWNGTSSVNSDTYLSDFVGSTITGTANSGNQVTATVLQVAASEGSDPNTLYIKYNSSGGTNNTVQKFVAGELFQSNGTGNPFGMVGGGSNTDNANTASTITNPIGQGSAVNIEEGVYFISGSFVYVPSGSLILDKYTNTPNYIVGLKVTQNTISSDSNSDLVDNAQGTPNYSAPGADRYQITTTLVKQNLDLANRTEDSYITLLVIEGGKARSDKTDKNNDTELSERLARRTFEESGDYSLNPYQLNVREHLDNGSNNGYLTSANGGNADKLAIGVEPNTSYVKGFRVENTTTKYVEVDKPRGTDAKVDVNQERQTLSLGNYIKLDESGAIGMPDITNFSSINLHSSPNGGGSIVGTARARGITQGSSSTELYIYLFDISFTGSNTFANVASLQWDDSGTAKFQANLTSDKTLYGTNSNTLVYKLPYAAIDTLRDPGSTIASPSYNTSFTVRQTFNTASQTATDTLAGAVFINQGNVVAYIYNTSSGTYGALDASPTCAISGGGNTITFTTINSSPVSLGANDQIFYAVDVTYSAQQAKSKQKQAGATVSGTLTNSALSLGKADIIKINSITDANSQDVKSRFTLDNGQKDNYYGIGKIILKSGESDPGTITVNFDYYTHTGTADFFSVDSYPTADYASIPTFTGINGTVQLRDCIDFRPRINDAGTGFTGTGASLSSIPSNSQSFITDLSHYLPRVDKLYVTRRGEFKVAVGVPDNNPKPPQVPDDAMGIYNLRLSPYVFSLNGIKPQIVENKRFTMRDIGSIEKRVKNLEYFTSLSLLEQSAADVDITDSAGTTRLKNGFIVDNFTNHGIGDTSNVDYSVSVDKQNGLLRPKFDERNVNLIRLAGDTGAVINNGIVTMPMTTDVNYINQPYASTFSNVNPYNVFSWAGTIKLSPDSDEWKEVDVRPSVVVDDSSSYDQFKKLAEEEGILGTVWNEWETNWTGVEVETQNDVTGTPPARRQAQEILQASNWWWADGEPEFDFFDIGTAGGGQQSTTITTTTTTTGQSRSGIKTDLAFDTVTRTDGQRVVEMNFVPFIRSREIYFKAELLKPNTQVYAFFDGANISDYIRGHDSTSNNPFVEFSGRSSITTFEGSIAHPDGAYKLVTNGSGVVEGSFIIPRNNALKFATGVREFRLSDSSTNNRTNETTYAEAQYHAQGLLETTEERIVSTKVPRLVQSELREDRTLVDTNVSETTEWIDPVAETILIDKAGGIFMKSIDIYFKSKDTSIPVRLTVRTTKNGIPTQKIVPGADKILYPSSVNVSSTAATATNFAFDNPVYLSQDTEYAIVLTSQCDSYEVWIAEMGGFDVTDVDQRITKQPYNGVFFSSANASTWTPEQSKDLKFKLNRASFSGSSSKITFCNDVVPPKKLNANPFYITDSSSTVRVFHKNHGMYSTSWSVTIAGVTGGPFNGIPASDLEGTHTITAFGHDYYEFSVSTTAGTAGSAYAGGSGVTATENRHIDVLFPVIQNMQVPGTSVRFYLKTYTSRSADGSEATEVLTTSGTDGYEILPNQNYYFATPMAIYSAINETNLLSGVKSFQLTAVLSTTDEALSPVIDMNRLSVNTIQNIISNDGGSETDATGGAESARYITKVIELAEQADIATVYINALKPGGSDIDLYWRATQGDEDITSVNWEIKSPVGGTIPFNATRFQEAQYDIDPFGLNSSFSSIQFKIVLKAESSSQVPMVKDFRAICAT